MTTNSQPLNLKAETREIFGRKVKTLRSKGIIPANIYGKGLESVAIQVDLVGFNSIYNEAGETSVVYIQGVGKEARPVLINQVIFDPVTDKIDHVDFRQVDLKVKITTHVPLELIGEAPAVKEKNAVIVQTLEEVEVEALPTDLPESIEVDISSLTEIGDSIAVGDLIVPKEIEILSDKETPVVSAQEVKEEVEVEPETTAEEGASETKDAGAETAAETPAKE